MSGRRLVGREEERARIRAVLDRLPEGGGSLLITGEAGIGKTTLLRDAEIHAAERGALVLSITAAQSESHLPFAALHELVHPFESRIAGMRPRQRAALEAALGRTSEPPSDVFLVGLGVLQLLSELGNGRGTSGGGTSGHGVLVSIDDSRWLDPSSAQVLAFVARRIASDPVAVLLTQRTGPSTVFDDANVEHLEVPPLSSRSAADLLDEARGDLDPDARARVGVLAEGNPLALLELPAPADAARGSGASGTAGFGNTGPIDLGDRLGRAFTVRWSALDDTARTALLIAAVNDGPSLSEVGSAAKAIGHTITLDTIDDLSAAGALRVHGDTVEFRHPLVRSGVIDAASDRDRRGAHAALAGILRKAAPDRAAWHLAASVTEPDEAAASALDAVARIARSSGDLEVELRALSRSAELSQDGDARARRGLRAAEVAVALSRPEVARTVMPRLGYARLDTHEAARLALLHDSLDAGVHTGARLGQLTAHAEAVTASDPDLAVELLIAAGAHLTASSFTLPADAALRAARALADVLGEEDSRSVAVSAVIDPLNSSERVRRHVSALDPLNLDAADEVLMNTTAFVIDADADLVALQAAVIDNHRLRGELRAIASLQVVHCWTAITLADWPQALQAADEGARLAQDAGAAQWEAGSLIATAIIAAFRGDREAAHAAMSTSESLAASRGAQNVLTGIQLTKGIDHIARGEYDEATSALARVFDRADPSFHPVQSSWCLGDLAEAAAHSGRIGEVHDIIAAQHDEQVATPWQRMAAEYATPFLADDPEAAFLAALHGRVARWPTYRVRMLVEYGAWLRRHRRIAEARERLRAARDGADAFGLHPWSERARAELRAMGEDSAAPSVARWESLSPQELQVAQLAASGLSNREIGERLFLSHRTVGSHLYRIFPKVGVTNRAQLAAIVGVSRTSGA